MEPTTETYTKRRSRMHRTITGKRIELQPRDLEIFKLLNRYRYLRSTFIHAFVGGDKTKLIERLGHLYHERAYLDRPAQQWTSINARYQPAVYENTAKAEEVLRTYGLLGKDTSTWLARGRMGAHRQFAHALMICDILASIELDVKQELGLRFISWQEIMTKAPETTRNSGNPFQIPVSIAHTFPRTKHTHRADIHLTPDGLFGLEYAIGGKKTYRFFALEADRTSMPVFRRDLRQTSYLKKILAYRQIAAQEIYRAHLGVPNLLVLNVTTNDRHMRSIMQLVDELTGRKGSKLFLFKTLPTLGALDQAPKATPDMLGTPWERVGHGAFHISCP